MKRLTWSPMARALMLCALTAILTACATPSKSEDATSTTDSPSQAAEHEFQIDLYARVYQGENLLSEPRMSVLEDRPFSFHSTSDNASEPDFVLSLSATLEEGQILFVGTMQNREGDVREVREAVPDGEPVVFESAVPDQDPYRVEIRAHRELRQHRTPPTGL